MNERKSNTPDQDARSQVELAAQRTRDALERTLMSWIRTTLSMITYGFGLFKVLQYMLKDHPEVGHGAADWLTLALVAFGVVLLVMAMVQYHVALRALRHEYHVDGRLPLPLVAAAGVVVAGLFAMMNLLYTVI